MKRVISLFAAVVMVLSVFGTAGVFAESSVTVTSRAAGSTIPAGGKVVVEADGTEGADSVEFFRSADGKSYTSLGTAEPTDAKIEAVIMPGSNYIKAAADFGGSIVEAEPIRFEGKYINEAKSIIETDFDGVEVRTDVPQFKWKGGNAMATRLNERVSYSKSSTDELSIDDMQDTHGSVLKMGKISAESEFSLIVPVSNAKPSTDRGMYVMEFDYYLDELPETDGVDYISRVFWWKNEGTVTATDRIGSDVKIKTKDNVFGFYDPDETTLMKKIEAKNWYNVKVYFDTEKTAFYYFIDGVYCGARYLGEVGFDRMEKMVIFLNKGSAETVYIDNLKVWEGTKNECSIQSNVSGEMPEGSIITLTAASRSGAPLIKIYESEDGVNYTELAAESSAKTVLTGYTKYYIAKSFDSDGVLRGVSEPLALSGYRLENVKTYWELDFENGEYAFNSAGQLTKDGGAVTNGDGEKFSAVSGGSTNTVTVGEPENIIDNPYGNCLMLTTSDTSVETLINNIPVNAVGGTLVASCDFATSANPNNTVVLRFAYSSDADASQREGFLPTVNVDNSGYFKFNGASTGVAYEANKWYNIKLIVDMESNTMTLYINNEYVTALTTSYNIAKIWYGGTTNARNVEKTTYYDNFKIHSVRKQTAVLGIKGVEYKINGEKTEYMSDGTLTASAIITNDGEFEASAVCIYAVYDGECLVNVSMSPVSFAEGEMEKHLPEADLGTVSEDMKVKVMLWRGMDSLSPVDDPDGLE